MKKTVKAIIAIILAITCVLQPCTAFAATFTGNTYVKEMIISYGDTEEKAKAWLKDKGYKVIDNNLNEGADDTFSTKRAVYLGYKTTSKVSEAITDMKVMNMKGGYSIEDYQLLLKEQKSTIQTFINNFMVAVNEFRTNYKNGQQRAISAFEMLNLMYDNDTEEYLGDLFLNKFREEYTDEEYNALSKDEKSKVGDLTTILMQANGTAVIAMEQIIALATDDGDTTWIERYQNAKTYDEMVDDLMDNDDLTISQATKKLAAKYDSDAKAIAAKFASYKEYLKDYTDCDIKLSNSQEEIEAYQKAHEDFDLANWMTVGTQYESLKLLENDGVTLDELITGSDYDVENEDCYLLYPLVASLTDGQRACLDFTSMRQIVSMGLNTDEATKEVFDSVDFGSNKKCYVSIYDGVDRSIFTERVALTGDAYKLQNSSDKNAMDNWQGYISSATKILYVVLGMSVAITVATWGYDALLKYNYKTQVNMRSLAEVNDLKIYDSAMDVVDDLDSSFDDAGEAVQKKVDDIVNNQKTLKTDEITGTLTESRAISKIFDVIGVAATCVTLALLAVSIWSTYNDLKAYYNAEFTPIPMHMVNQGVNEKDEKVFTYYTAVKCNREEAQLVTDRTKILEDYGDLNGDVGKQWVALYTTKDSAAGDPITTDFAVQYANSNVPGESTALSAFCESTAQNLTDEKLGYTYNDGKNGIYLFFGTDNTAYAGSAVSNGIYALAGGCSVAVFAAITYFATTAAKKKKEKASGKEDTAND